MRLYILLTIFLGVYFRTQAQQPLEFIANKGQWQGPYTYRTTTPGGDVYFNKSSFRYLLSHSDNKDKIHGLKHGWVKGPQTLQYHVYEMSFLNTNQDVTFTEEKKQKHYYNYFYGNNPDNWKSGIHPVLAFNYQKLYNHIDVHVSSDNSQIKYDFIVHPQGDYKQIQMSYKGLDELVLKDNKLILKTSLGAQQEQIPSCYQFIDGEKIEVACKYVLRDGIVSFDIDKKYNKNYDLIIDPTLVFCSFTGSTADNWGFTATYDSSGNFYAGGIVIGPLSAGQNYPVTTGAIQLSYGGGNATSTTSIGVATDITVTKYNANGSAVIYATYLGGSDNEQPHSLIVDHQDNLIIAGRTGSVNYPINATIPTWDNTLNGGTDIVVTKFNSAGTQILGSTYVGGSANDGVNTNILETQIGGLKHNYADDARSEVIVDINNNIYVAGCTNSSDFPSVHPAATANSYGGGQDGVLIKLTPTCSNLLWSVFIGGSSNDAAYVLSFNKSNQNELFVAGGTESSTLLNTNTSGVIHNSNQGGIDGFLLKYNTATMATPIGTFIGTSSYDQVYGVQTDDSNHVYIVGQTTGAYPVSAGVYSNPNSSQFLAKISNNLNSQLFSTVFGNGNLSSVNISINAFLVDKCNNIYVSGWGGPLSGFNVPGSTTNGLPVSTSATNLPIKSTTDGEDFYFFVISKNFQNLVYATFFGQNSNASGGFINGGEHVDGGTSRFDEKGVIYQAICGNCGGSTWGTFPTSSGAVYQNNLSPNCNLAALKIKFDLLNPAAEASAGADTLGCAPLTVNFQNYSVSATNYFWSFGDGNTSTLDTPQHTYLTPGTYTVRLIANNPNGCNYAADTTFLTIHVLEDTVHAGFTVKKLDSCTSFLASFTNNSTTNLASSAATTYTWDFGDGTSFTGQNPPNHTYSSLGSYQVTLTMSDPNACNSPSIFIQTVNFNNSFMSADFFAPDTICLPASVLFTDMTTNANTWNWIFGDGATASTASPTHTYTTTGTYTVYLVAGNPNTCNKLDTAQLTIHVFNSPVADFTWYPNPPTPNTPNDFKNLSIGATSYLWDFGDGYTSTDKDVTHVYQQDGYYDVCLTAFNESGCKDTTCKKVRGLVIPIADVPTGFSPNGDGSNDVVYVRGYGIKNLDFKIYNRWGEKIFESHAQKDGWDGRYKGVMQEMEVYQYVLKVEFMDGSKTTKKGNITLLR